MVETTVDELACFWVLDLLERLRLDALGNLAIDLRLVGALGVWIFFSDLDGPMKVDVRIQHDPKTMSPQRLCPLFSQKIKNPSSFLACSFQSFCAKLWSPVMGRVR